MAHCPERVVLCSRGCGIEGLRAKDQAGHEGTGRCVFPYAFGQDWAAEQRKGSMKDKTCSRVPHDGL